MLKRISLSITLFLGLVLAGQALAGQGDLGSRWPNAADVSASPYFHVYVFQKAGVKYIQVNDLSGTVRQAIASSGNQLMVLPMGVDAARVTTAQQQVPTATTSTQPVVVYQDANTSVVVAPDGAGNLNWKAVTAASCSPPECSNQNQQPTGH